MIHFQDEPLMVKLDVGLGCTNYFVYDIPVAAPLVSQGQRPFPS